MKKKSRLLKDGGPAVSCAYDPTVYDPLIDVLYKPTPISIYYGPPWYLGSPRTRIYLAENVHSFVGYLSKFEPSESGEGEPEATIEIVPVSDQQT